MAEFPLLKMINIDGRQTPFAFPQHNTLSEGYKETGEENPLPTKDKSLEARLSSIENKLDNVMSGNAVNTNVTGKINVNDIDKLLSNQNKIINVMQSDKLIFGVHWDKKSSPDLTRIDDAEGLVAEVGVNGDLVRNDFDRMPIYSEMREVEDEYGNKFIRIPKFYIQKSSGKNHLIKRISKTRYPGFYLPKVFWDFGNNKELDYFDFGKYNASLGGGDKLESKPNKQPLVRQNIVNFRTYAQNNNDEELKGYQQLDIHAIDVLQTLFTVEFATLNSQSIMSGFTSGPYAEAHVITVAKTDTNEAIVANATANTFVVGQSIGLGTSRGGQQIAEARLLLEIKEYDDDNKALVFDGEKIDTEVDNYVYSNGWISGFSADIASSSGSIESNTGGKYPCSYRGIENPWGSIYQWIDGININDHKSWIANNADDYASNVFASPYEKTDYKNAEANGYVAEMGYDSSNPFVEIPVKATGAGTATYYADNYYQVAGQRIALFGGRWNAGAAAGLWFWGLSASSAYTHVGSGGRLLKKAF